MKTQSILNLMITVGFIASYSILAYQMIGTEYMGLFSGFSIFLSMQLFFKNKD